MSTTRFPNGVTNVAKNNPLGQMGQLDPTKYHSYFTDFDTFNINEWDVTADVGTPTRTLIDGEGGLLKLTNSAAANDRNEMVLKNNGFTYQPGKKMFFKTKLQINDIFNTTLVIGPWVTANRLNFISNPSTYEVTFRLQKDGNNIFSTANGIIADNF